MCHKIYLNSKSTKNECHIVEASINLRAQNPKNWSLQQHWNGGNSLGCSYKTRLDLGEKSCM